MIARLPLVPDGEDFDPIRAWRHAVERDVSGPAVGDHQFAQRTANRTPDVRMTLEDPDRVENHLACIDRSGGIRGGDEVKEPVEIGKRVRGVGDSGQLRPQGSALPPARAPKRQRAPRGLSCGASHDVRAHVFGGIERPTGVNLGG